MRTKEWRLYLTSIALLSVSTAWLYPFTARPRLLGSSDAVTCILLNGTHQVAEPCLPILLGKIAMFLALITLSISNLIVLVRRATERE